MKDREENFYKVELMIFCKDSKKAKEKFDRIGVDKRDIPTIATE